MFEYFYNDIFRKTIIGFGSLFNNIQIQKTKENGQVISIIKVPLAYGPTQKFLARINENPSLDKATQITLPRMSFELMGIRYDSTRKATQTQTFISSTVSDSSDIRKTYLPVPYNLEFQLSIFTKLNDDMLQVIEQILPYFQPAYTLSLNLIDVIGEKRDVPIILESITMDDDYEGDYSTRRALIYTLNFTAKTYLFGPTSGTSKDIIKKATLNLVSGDPDGQRIKDVSYSVEPIATKSYTNNIITTLSQDLSFTNTNFLVNDSSQIISGSRIVIGEETMLVKNVEENNVTVERGYYSTPISQHLSGSNILLITDEDNLLIEPGDDFGFSGSLL
jgi:hypothetical protein